MNTRRRILTAMGTVVLAATGLVVVTRVSSMTAPAGPPDRAAAAEETFGRLPLTFEANVGQTDPQVRYLARTSTGTLFLTDSSDAVLAGNEGALRLRLDGATPDAAVEPLGLEQSETNYIRGDDPASWHTGVPSFDKVAYRSVYPGIDLVWHGTRGGPEYDFVVSPGADPASIALVTEGGHDLRLDDNGDLVQTLGGAEVRQHRPQLYQDVDGDRRVIDGSYVLGDAGTVRFAVGPYDTTLPLVIDPVIVYSTYLGGNEGSGSESGLSIAVDSSNSAYITGTVNSTDFPTVGAVQPSIRGGSDVFITKLNPEGTALVYSTYFGGNSTGDSGRAIAVDASGSAYVGGATLSSDFPTTPGVVQGAGSNPNGLNMAFVTKLTPMGTLAFSTYLGGNSGGNGNGYQSTDDIAVNSSGEVYVSGGTLYSNFPVVSAAQPMSGGVADLFLSKLNATGTAFVFSTYLGGSDQERGSSMALDAAGNAYVSGTSNSPSLATTPASFQPVKRSGPMEAEAVVAKYGPTGTLLYASWLGGSDGANSHAIAVDGSGNAYVTGSTGSDDFPLAGNPFQTTRRTTTSTGFVTKVNPPGTSLVYSTYLGGTSNLNSPEGIAVDASGSAHIAGMAVTYDHPMASPIQATKAGGYADPFISVLTPTGSALSFSTYLGGSTVDSAFDIALDSAANMYITGSTSAYDYPTTAGSFQPAKTAGDQNDAFITKISPAGPPTSTTTTTRPTTTTTTRPTTTTTTTVPGARPTVSIGDVAISEGDAKARIASFALTLSKASTQTVTVNYATATGTAAGSDFASKANTVTFAAGKVKASVSVPVKGDTVDEADEAFSVNLSAPVNATIADGTGAGTIRDDDPGSGVRATISDVTLYEGNAGAQTATFTVSLSAPSATTVTVNYATANGTATSPGDYAARAGTVTFAPGSVSKSVAVNVKSNTGVEPDETFTVGLSGPTGGATITDPTGVGSIRNDD